MLFFFSPILQNKCYHEAIKLAMTAGHHGRLPRTVLDIGTGTGLLAMMCAKTRDCHVTAAEVCFLSRFFFVFCFRFFVFLLATWWDPHRPKQSALSSACNLCIISVCCSIFAEKKIAQRFTLFFNSSLLSAYILQSSFDFSSFSSLKIFFSPAAEKRIHDVIAWLWFVNFSKAGRAVFRIFSLHNW